MVKTLHDGQFLKLLRDGHWEYVTRQNNAHGAAAMVAVTEAREIVLVEQYRIPLHARTIELPAGIIGDAQDNRDESIESSALRELLEETGYRGSVARVLCSGPTAPGLTSEFSNLVLVTGLKREHDCGGVEGEDITVHVVALDQVHDWLEAQRGKGLLIEPRVYAGLYFVLAGKTEP
ncbi:MAG TPA: NUDIX hydrolase [Solimonas sp.]|nr:NUDIX hydrolase [Solimonas sp.]